MQTPIGSILADTSQDRFWTVAPSATAHEAVQLMVDKRIEALLVLEQGKLVGILTERDFARRLWLPGKDPQRMSVADVMSSPVVFVSRSHTIGDCMTILSEHNFTHLPVLEGDRVVGMVVLQDLVYRIMHDQHRVISHLEAYITGTYAH